MLIAVVGSGSVFSMSHAPLKALEGRQMEAAFSRVISSGVEVWAPSRFVQISISRNFRQIHLDGPVSYPNLRFSVAKSCDRRFGDVHAAFSIFDVLFRETRSSGWQVLSLPCSFVSPMLVEKKRIGFGNSKINFL